MKRLSIVVALALTSLGVSAVHAESRIDRIKANQVITIGYQEASVPFSYLDDQQKPIGYSMDICRNIAAALKESLGLPALEIKLVPVTAITRIPLVANGTADLACTATTNTVDRQAQASFTPTTFLTATRFAALKSSNLKTLDDFRGKTVVSVAGSNNLRWLTQVNTEKKLGMKIIGAASQPEAFLAVANGRAAAHFMDDVLLATLVAGSHNPNDWMIGDETYTIEPYSILQPKNDKPFKDEVDNAVKTMMKDGTMAKLYDKWFTQPIPPKGINLNWAMTPELKKAFEHPTDSADPAAYSK